MTKSIDANRERFRVEPICSAPQVAPSTYYAATTRPASPRSRSDALLKPELLRVHAANYGVYGVRKLWRQLTREGVTVGRDRVHRLMQELGLTGVVRGKRTRGHASRLVDAVVADPIVSEWLGDVRLGLDACVEGVQGRVATEGTMGTVLVVVGADQAHDAYSLAVVLHLRIYCPRSTLIMVLIQGG